MSTKTTVSKIQLVKETASRFTVKADGQAIGQVLRTSKTGEDGKRQSGWVHNATAEGAEETFYTGRGAKEQAVTGLLEAKDLEVAEDVKVSKTEAKSTKKAAKGKTKAKSTKAKKEGKATSKSTGKRGRKANLPEGVTLEATKASSRFRVMDGKKHIGDLYRTDGNRAWTHSRTEKDKFTGPDSKRKAVQDLQKQFAKQA